MGDINQVIKSSKALQFLTGYESKVNKTYYQSSVLSRDIQYILHVHVHYYDCFFIMVCFSCCCFF